MACARKKHSGCNPIAKIRIISAFGWDAWFQTRYNVSTLCEAPRQGESPVAIWYMLHITPEAVPFFRLTCTPRSGCVNQSVVSIRQFADASSLGSVPSSMEMAGSCKCCIHRRQRYKIVPSIVVNTRQEYAIHTWTF